MLKNSEQTAKGKLKKKLLVLTTTYPRWRGDTEPAFVHYLSRGLQDAFEVHVLAPHTLNAKTIEALEGVQVHRFRYLPVTWQRLAYEGGIVPRLKQNKWLALQIPFLLFFMFWSGLKLAKKYEVDVIHAHWVIPQGFIALLIKRFCSRSLKVMVTSHGADLFSLNNAFLKRFKARVFARADCVTVVSQAMREFCRNDLGVRRVIHVRSMGIDCKNIFLDRVDHAERSGFIFAGRLVEKKGVRYLLQAFAKLVKERPDEKLLVVGDGTEKKTLMQLSLSLGLEKNVTFRGAVETPELADLFNQAAVAVVPSIIAADGDQEGLGLVAAEALACGCITLVSDLPAIRDVHDDRFLQFRQADMESLYQALVRVLDEPAEARRRSRLLQQKVIRRFDWSRVADEYKTLMGV